MTAPATVIYNITWRSCAFRILTRCILLANRHTKIRSSPLQCLAITPHSNREPLSQRLRVPSRHCSAVPTTSVRLHPNSIPNGNRQPDPDTKSCEADKADKQHGRQLACRQRPDPLGTKARPKRATNTKQNKPSYFQSLCLRKAPGQLPQARLTPEDSLRYVPAERGKDPP